LRRSVPTHGQGRLQRHNVPKRPTALAANCSRPDEGATGQEVGDLLLVRRRVQQPCSARVGSAERQAQSRWAAAGRLQANFRREQCRVQQLQPTAQLNRQRW